MPIEEKDMSTSKEDDHVFMLKMIKYGIILVLMHFSVAM